jgi:hypothetical protein
MPFTLTLQIDESLEKLAPVTVTVGTGKNSKLAVEDTMKLAVEDTKLAVEDPMRNTANTNNTDTTAAADSSADNKGKENNAGLIPVESRFIPRGDKGYLAGDHLIRFGVHGAYQGLRECLCATFP